MSMATSGSRGSSWRMISSPLDRMYFSKVRDGAFKVPVVCCAGRMRVERQARIRSEMRRIVVRFRLYRGIRVKRGKAWQTGARDKAHLHRFATPGASSGRRVALKRRFDGPTRVNSTELRLL